ncbi:uncharacterized protein LOC143214087 [Lasioglossum baleicum]|uniref:uncharacterized protein LOC143214087 n=1 Tax=Lasioglossum baleicum TaxID=434251 RepID=UPI003FCD15C7
MRVLVLVLAVLAVSCGAYSTGLELLEEPIAGGSHPDIPDIPDEDGGQLVGFLEKLKAWMKTGNDKPKIPILDPLKKDHLELNINNQKTGIILQAALDNLRVLGLADFVVNKGDFKLIGLKANIDLTWKNIDLFTMYELIKARIQSPPIAFNGTGAILAILKDLRVSADAKLSMNADDKLFVKEIKMGIQLGKLEFTATGLLNDEEISQMISRIVSDLVPQILRDYPKEISEKSGELVKKVLDNVLSKLSLKDLIELIGS